MDSIDERIQTEKALALGGYKVLVVDPPWDTRKTGKRAVRPNQGERLEYPTMTIEALKGMEVGLWGANQSWLWLWATNGRSQGTGRPILAEAFDLLEAWGYRYYTLVTWDKGTGVCPFGPYQITSEHLLFGYRTKLDPPVGSMGKAKTVFQAPVTRHSEKPGPFYEYVRSYFPGPRLDVFARRRHLGFDAWGSEVEGQAAIQNGCGICGAVAGVTAEEHSERFHGVGAIK